VGEAATSVSKKVRKASRSPSFNAPDAQRNNFTFSCNIA